MSKPFPKSQAKVVTLSNGEKVTVKTFNALQVLEDDRISTAFAQIYETAEALGQQATANYSAQIMAAGLNAEQVSQLSDVELIRLGIVIKSPSTMKVITACRAPLAQLVRAALGNKPDTFFEEIGVDDLLILIGAVYAVNVERYAGKLKECLVAVTQALRGIKTDH